MSIQETYNFFLTSKEYIIKEHLLDSYGHMNNASYIQLYEEARWDLVSSRGYGLKEIGELQIGPVILDLKCKFQKEIRPRELITITTQVTEYRGKIGVIRQQMIKASGDIASTADFTFGLFDLKARKLLAPTEKWLYAIGEPK